jgi:hypothetical protein
MGDIMQNTSAINPLQEIKLSFQLRRNQFDQTIVPFQEHLKPLVNKINETVLPFSRKLTENTNIATKNFITKANSFNQNFSAEALQVSTQTTLALSALAGTAKTRAMEIATVVNAKVDVAIKIASATIKDTIAYIKYWANKLEVQAKIQLTKLAVNAKASNYTGIRYVAAHPFQLIAGVVASGLIIYSVIMFVDSLKIIDNPIPKPFDIDSIKNFKK